MKNILFFVAVFAAFLSSCTKGDTTPINANPTGSIKVKMDPHFNDGEFAFGSPVVTAAGDSITITAFKYYISNIMLKKTDGTFYVQPESYYLVNHDTGAVNIEFGNIPAGDYTEIIFTLGIDSAAQVSGSTSGALNPSLGMYNSTNGYSSLKMEGNSPQAFNGSFNFDVWGYKQPVNANRTINASLNGKVLSISPTSKPSVHYHVDIDKLFSNVHQIRLSSLSQVNGGDDGLMLADNYSGMFRIDHVH
jgi:hypothetical protein